MTHEILFTERNLVEKRGQNGVEVTFARVVGRLEDGREFSFAVEEALLGEDGALEAKVEEFVAGLPA